MQPEGHRFEPGILHQFYLKGPTMMCCILRYKKFVDENGNIDEEKQSALIEESQKSKLDVYWWAKYNKERLTFEAMRCSCPCHIEGKSVLH